MHINKTESVAGSLQWRFLRRSLDHCRVVASLLGLLLLAVFCSSAQAANATSDFVTSATPGNFSICVRASYGGDDNGNNTLLVEWGLNGVDYSLGSQLLPHASSYTDTISGLTSGTVYQVRVTCQDAENDPYLVVMIANVTPQSSSLLHNSIITGSDKWGGRWGVPGGQYGEFSCSTCHIRMTSNVKRVRSTLAAPNGTDQLPIENAAGSVILTDLRDGSSDCGDDLGGHALSDKICEACHLITDYHRYDTITDPDDAGPLTAQVELDHYNRSDCIRCHPHNNGFAHGASGAGCDSCHGKDADNDGVGTTQSHSTHTESDGDDLRGPALACDICHDTDNFPYFKSGTDGNSDGKYSLAETDVCDSCHSPGGTYDGVDDAVIGAKNIWGTGAYTSTDSSVLVAGKEAWCASCHDEVPSIIGGISGPNIVGDEDGAYSYGSGWGYYKTGHGLSGQEYPSSGGMVAGANLACDACHDYSMKHVDAAARTYVYTAITGADDDYQHGYRLKSVDSNLPMVLPRDNGCISGVNASDFRLCLSCHDSGPFVNSGNTDTNFRTAATNSHYLHLAIQASCGAGLKFASDWDAHDYDSQPSCITCHNVHGSTQLSMVRDGQLVDKTPGIQVSYFNAGVATPCPGSPSLADVTLPESTGTVWNPNTLLCGTCHGGCGFSAVYERTPFDSTPPVISNVYGKSGSNLLAVKFSESVYTNNNATGNLSSGDLTFVDSDNGRLLSSTTHTAGDAFCRQTLGSALDATNDIGTDTLAAASATSIYDLMGNAMGTATTVLEEDSAVPTISDRSPADAATAIAINDNITFTLADSASGVDWTTFSITLTGDTGYSQTYTDADITVASKTGAHTSYAVTVNPDVNFSYAEFITATVNVDDLIGNAMTPSVWSFTTQGGGPFTQTLHPSGLADNTGTFVTSGGDWANILDSNDGDTTYVHRCCGPAGPTFHVDIDNPTGLDNASIQSIRFHVYARYMASAADTTPLADDLNIGYKTGTNTVWDGNVTTDTSGSYNLISSAIYTTDSDGGALDPTDINNLQIAVQRNNAGTAPKLLVTEVYAEITYGVVEGDTQPPAIPDLSPANSATEVLIDSNLTFTLVDNEGGVDWSTFEIQLSGDQGYSKTYTDLSAEVSTTGNMASYDVTVDPDTNFGGEEVITVTVNVDDRAGNSLTPPSWSFTTDVASAPLTTTLYPSGKNASSAVAWYTNGDWVTALDTNDADSTYAYICCTGANSKLYMDMDDPVGLESATIQSITFHAYARGVVGTGPQPEQGAIVSLDVGYKTGTNMVWRGSFTTTHTGVDMAYDFISSTTYTTDSDGGALDLTDINNINVVVNWPAGRLRVTQVYVEVTYLP